MPALPMSPGAYWGCRAAGGRGYTSVSFRDVGLGGVRSRSSVGLVWVESHVLPYSHRAARAAEPYGVQGPRGCGSL